MRTLCRFRTMFVAVLFASAGWAANPQGQAEATVGRGEFPFKLFGGYLIVMEGRIGDHSKLKFTLDTGVQCKLEFTVVSDTALHHYQVTSEQLEREFAPTDSRFGLALRIGGPACAGE